MKMEDPLTSTSHTRTCAHTRTCMHAHIHAYTCTHTHAQCPKGTLLCGMLETTSQMQRGMEMREVGQVSGAVSGYSGVDVETE